MAFADFGPGSASEVGGRDGQPGKGMARREWNVARNGQFGRLAKSAGFRRNPIDTQGSARSGKKKSQPDKGWDFTLWWNRGELNPRPQAITGRFYMLS